MAVLKCSKTFETRIFPDELIFAQAFFFFFFLGIAVDAPKRIDPRRLIKKCTEEEKKHKFIQSLLTMIRVDLAYQILDQEEQLATFMDERGTSPLHLLADKPSAFKSGCRLGWWSSIIYYCKCY
ncbi:hypothetical protein CFP56_034116 [Quercus suber]|uniref:Uncharacterized protein n=1 Tax=Quercus suber TaxID=58331 RepID=A0AAW0LQZ0_QUESU